jgi:hypothetical protein
MSGRRLSVATAVARATSRVSVLATASIVLSSLSPAARAERQTSTSAADLKLVIAVDVSTSMSDDEQRLQREGYASTLRSPDVMRTIKSGRRGRIAIAYFEWARPEYQRLIVPWTVIDGPAEAAAIADEIERQPSVPQGGTSISAALMSAGRLLRTAELASDREIVDVSGDGPNNSGPRLQEARASLIRRGVTINGLATSLSDSRYDMIESFPLDFVESHYKHCMIGGFGAFVLAVGDRADFARSIRLKLIAEIAESPEPALTRQRARQVAAYSIADCDPRRR